MQRGLAANAFKGRTGNGAAFAFGTLRAVKHLSRKNQGLIAINIAAVIFGSAALYGRLPVSPFWIVAMRALFAAAGLLAVGLARSSVRKLPRGLLKSIVATGVLLAIHWVTFFLSVQWGGVAIATLTFAGFPLFTVLIECRRAKRRLHTSELLAGVVIIVAVASLLDRRSTAGAGAMAGVVAGVACAIAFAYFGVASKGLARDLSALQVSLYQNIVVFTVLLPFLPFAWPTPHGGEIWLWLVLLGVVTTALMHQLYFYALQRLSASTCSGFIALEPVYAIIFAAILFRDPITIRVAIAGALIIGASIILHRLEAVGDQGVVDMF